MFELGWRLQLKPQSSYKIVTSNWLAYSSRFEKQISLPSQGLVDPLEGSEWTGAPRDGTSSQAPALQALVENCYPGMIMVWYFGDSFGDPYLENESHT